MTRIARGTFTVRLNPLPPAEGHPFAGLLLDKEYHGDLAGTSKGHMLAAETAVQGSAGYVALELVTGTLNGRRGTFVLQHTGTMARGAMTIDGKIIPDSGTADLAGIVGRYL